MSKSKSLSMLVLVAAIGVSACSSSSPKTSSSTTIKTGSTLAAASTTAAGGLATGSSALPVATATPTESSTTTSTTIATTNGKDWEVVVGTSYKSEADAQAAIAKLNKANFAKFVTKKLTASWAVVYAGISQQQASNLAQRINDKKIDGLAKATIFHLQSGGTTASSTTTKPGGSTTTSVASSKANYQVTVGPYDSKSKAQTALNKLVAAKITGFAITGSNGKYNLVRKKLTKTDANTIQKKITNAGLGTAKVSQSS